VTPFSVIKEILITVVRDAHSFNKVLNVMFHFVASALGVLLPPPFAFLKDLCCSSAANVVTNTRASPATARILSSIQGGTFSRGHTTGDIPHAGSVVLSDRQRA